MTHLIVVTAMHSIFSTICLVEERLRDLAYSRVKGMTIGVRRWRTPPNLYIFKLGIRWNVRGNRN